MSDASIKSYVVVKEKIDVSNQRLKKDIADAGPSGLTIHELQRKVIPGDTHPHAAGTPYQRITGAVSQMAKDGELEEHGSRVDEETNQPNTVYRVPAKQLAARPGNTYKARFEAAQEQIKAMNSRIECLITQNEKLRDELQQLKAQLEVGSK